MYRRIFSCLVAPLFFAAPAAAQQVTLTATETGLALTGEIILFDGARYRFKSSIGELLINANEVECRGAACPGEASSADGSFGIFGSNTVGASLMPNLIDAWATSVGGGMVASDTENLTETNLTVSSSEDVQIAQISLRSEGSSTSFPALLSGEAQIGMSSRKVKGAEISTLIDAGIVDIDQAGREHVLALDGLIVIVAQDNPLQSISMADLARVFSGEVQNWAEIGGDDAPITLYARDGLSGTWDAFKSLVLKPANLELASAANRYTSNEELSDAVADDPNGIGFTGFAYENDARALSLTTSCGLETSPDIFHVKTEEYPLSRRLYLYTTGAQLPAAASDILGYALSDEAQFVVQGAGFVDQTIDLSAIDMERGRLAKAAGSASDALSEMLGRSMHAELSEAVRLSSTFRFNPGDQELDVKSRSDVTRLARFITNITQPDDEIVIVGFDDNQDDLSTIDESLQRASFVADALRADLSLVGGSADVSLVPLAYGGLAPVACNDTEAGRIANRRVEVWLRKKG